MKWSTPTVPHHLRLPKQFQIWCLSHLHNQYAKCLETHRVSQCEKQDFVDLRPEYVDRTEASDLDLTRLRFQFHDDSSPESLHLTFDFGNHVELL